MKKARLFVLSGVSIIAVTLIFALSGMPGAGSSAAQGGGGQNELLAGRNVNMVSGTRLPWGDPWLQRQNEPSLAASSRNPMHFLAGANDYRTVDMPDDYKVPGIPPQAAARDAWLGVFKSFDGGQSWITTLLPGYPQDGSIEGLASPIHGLDAACDPCVRAGSNGMFYYSGIAFNRAGGAGALFLARYIDFNNLEKIKKTVYDNEQGKGWQWTVDDDPIRYVNTKVIDNCNPGQFIDMPSVAADIPRGAMPGSTMIKGQSVLNSSVYMAYTVFLGNFDVNVRSRLMFIRSANCGETWSAPIKLSESQHIIQRPIIAIDPSDPTGGTVYVAFRRFAFGNTAGGIVICKSIDGGRTFTKPIEVETLLYPFDQIMSGVKFRTNSYPTMAVDGAGRVHIAWAQRLGGPSAQSRIVLKTSPDGIVWTNPAVVVGNDPSFLGNQFMPAVTFAAGRLLLVWYDQRGTLSPDSASGAVADAYPNRQTIDVRACEAIPGPVPVFGPSYQVSRYLYYLELDSSGNPVPDGAFYKAVQAEYNPPNLPIFQLGTKPFDGDFIDLAAAPLILPPPVGGGSWAYNKSADGSHPVTFHSAWADNRDVRPPADGWFGSWANYTPPSSPQGDAYAHAGACDTNATGMRNQNVYTASIGKGIFVGSPGNTKQLDIADNISGGRRTFVVVVKNFTDYPKSLHMEIPSMIGGGNGWFKQNGTEKTKDIEVAAYSSYSCTVYVDEASGQKLPVKVDVTENGALVGYALLNPDPTTLSLDDPDNPGPIYGWYEKHTPRVQNPRVYNYDLGNKNEPNPRVMNPRVQNPRVMNPRVMNPRVQNPRVMNPRVMNPRVQNDSLVNQEVANPRVMNPRVQNTALTDVTWIVSNEGNTTSAFTFNIFSTVDQYFNGENPPLIGQVLVYKVHLAPGAYKCDLYETNEDELLVNYTNPRVQNPRVQNNVPDESTTQALSKQTQSSGANEDLPQDVTFYLAPGEEAYVTFRVWDDNTLDDIDFSAQTVTAYVEADAISTGGTTPEFALPEDGVPWQNPLPQIGTSLPSLSFYATPGTLPPGQQFNIWNTGGGSLDYTITLEAPGLSGSPTSWLSVSPPSGTSGPHNVTVTDSTLPVGVYHGNIVINDPGAANNPVRIPITLTIAQANTPYKLAFLQNPTTAVMGVPVAPPVTVEVQNLFGNRLADATNIITITLLGPGGGTLGGTPTRSAIGGIAAFSDLAVNAAGIGYSLRAGSAGLSGADSTLFDIIVPPDVVPPSVLGLNPANGATGVAPDFSLSITFDENVKKGTGDIVIRKVTDDAIFQTIAVTSSNVLISGSIATIRHVILGSSIEYYVQVAATCFEDLAGNAYAGIGDKTSWTLSVTDIPGLLALFPFNGNAADGSGNGNHGELHGSVAFVPDRFGNANGAIDLNGVDAFVDFPNNAAFEPRFDLTTFTIVAIVRIDDFTDRNTVITKGVNFGNFTMRVLSSSDPFPRAAEYVNLTSGGNWDAPISSGAVPAGQYFQIGVTMDPSQFFGYINGLRRGPFTPSPPILNDDKVSIGRILFSPDTYQYFKGQIDEIRIYGRVLTPTEMMSLYNKDR